MCLRAQCLEVGYEEGHSLCQLPRFELSRGDLMRISGRNGSGKTCLLKTLAGHLEPLAGEVRRPESISLFTSEYGLYETISVEDIFRKIRTVLKDRGGGKCRGVEVIDDALRLVNSIPDRSVHDIPLSMNGGHRRVLGTILALCTSSSCVLLDEPFEGLDNQLAKQTSEFISQIRCSCNLSIVITDHRDALGLLGNADVTIDLDDN